MNAVTCMFTRKAVVDDAGEVARLFIKNLWPIAHFTPDGPTVMRELFQAVTDGRVFVLEQCGKIIGCAAYFMARPWYLAHEQMYDQGIFVEAEYRKSRGAYLLDKALKDESEVLGKTLIYGANTKNEEAPRIMSKRYRKICETFVVREDHVRT